MGERESEREDGGVTAGRVGYQWGFCKDERRVCVCFYGIRWSALILSPHVRSRHDPPSRPYICILPLNSRAPCKHAEVGGRGRRDREGREGLSDFVHACVVMHVKERGKDGGKGGRQVCRCRIQLIHKCCQRISDAAQPEKVLKLGMF